MLTKQTLKIQLNNQLKKRVNNYEYAKNFR